MIETKERPERLILVAVNSQSGSDTLADRSLDELEELVKTAGAAAVGRLIQNRESIHPVTYLGTGKINELIELLYVNDADGIVCDDELSPVQLRNLQDILKMKVMDRTLVILDIFAKHATTHEGKIQVELAQLKYRATRLAGNYENLSRTGGGIGTRGPGEKKLETDRRVIHERIGTLKAELRDVVRHREVTRRKRKESMIPVVSLVGYTNAGKSTLFNRLTGAGVLAQDKLFATLDTSIRTLELAEGQKLLLSDTVGFINKLPHTLIDAFRSTLEEVCQADIILHVADACDPMLDLHMYVVYETLRELGVTNCPIITVFNKMDLVDLPENETRESLFRDSKASACYYVSAATGEGIEELCNAITDELRAQNVFVERLFHYSEMNKIAMIRQYGTVLTEEYTEDGVLVTGYVPAQLFGRLYD